MSEAEGFAGLVVMGIAVVFQAGGAAAGCRCVVVGLPAVGDGIVAGAQALEEQPAHDFA